MRVFSGVQPTGQLHIGNYLGASRRFTRLQHEAQCLFCVVDLHALTTSRDPQPLQAHTRTVAALYLASGIGPERATVFVQSHLAALAELVVDTLFPIQRRYHELLGEPSHPDAVLAAGGERARALAAQTLSTVRRRVGLLPPAMAACRLAAHATV